MKSPNRTDNVLSGTMNADFEGFLHLIFSFLD